MVMRRTLALAVSAIALVACQQHQDKTTEALSDLPTAPPADNVGVAAHRENSVVAADLRSQPQPEISYGAAAGTAGKNAGSAGSETGDVQLNFADTDIREIVRQVLGVILKVNYAVDPAVHGTATIETAKPLKREELLPTLQLLLSQNGASLVKNGDLYRILPSQTANQTPSLADPQTAGSEAVKLHYASAKDLAKVLEPFVADGARITPDDTHNVLLITGEPAARRTLQNLIGTFDTDLLAGQSFALFPVSDGEPGKVASELQKALATEGDSALAGVVRIVPMERAGAVLVVSQQPRYIDDAQRLFRLMEKARKDNERSWHVYYVQNGQANDVANLLQQAFTPNHVTAKADSNGSTAPGQGQSGIGGGSSGGFGGGGSGGIGGGSGGFGGSSGGSGGIGASSSGGGGLGTPSLLASSGSGAGSSSSTNSPFGSPSGGDSGGAQDSLSSGAQGGGGSGNTIRIIPNKPNNALLVFATQEEYGTIESMMHKIDIIPLQVRIDATIAEVDLNDQLQYGTQFFFQNQGLAGVLSQAGSGASTGTGGLLAGAPTPTTFASIGTSTTPLGFLLTNTSGPRVALSALQAVTNVRMLSSPQLMATDNQPAKLLVGDSVPFQNGSLNVPSGSTTGVTAATTTSYQQTGVIMQILPHVNSGGLVTLDIAQEVSAVVPGSNATTPTFSDRQVTTRVSVQDGQTIGIAGLIQDQSSEGNDGVPFLKDIPVLGAAFSTQSNTRARTELLIMITPHVVQDQRDARALTEDLRQTLSHAGLVPQQLKVLPLSGSANPNADMTQ
jgi:general secretion pathway protein D